MQTTLPLIKVLLLRLADTLSAHLDRSTDLSIALGSVVRKAAGRNERGAAAQQLQPAIIADLDAAAREQRHATAQISNLQRRTRARDRVGQERLRQ